MLRSQIEGWAGGHDIWPGLGLEVRSLWGLGRVCGGEKQTDSHSSSLKKGVKDLTK